MHYKIPLKLLLILIFIFNLSNCGYNLRGLNQPDLNIDSIFIDYADINLDNSNDKFIHTLANSFRAKDIVVITDENKAQYKNHNNTYKLEIITANLNKNIISSGSSKLIAQYKISFYTKFNFYNKNKKILSNQIINAQRNYNYTQDQILGLDYEENTIASELLQETTDRIITQLSTVIK